MQPIFSCILIALFLSARKYTRNVKAVFGYILQQNVKDGKMKNWLLDLRRVKRGLDCKEPPTLLHL